MTTYVLALLSLLTWQTAQDENKPYVALLTDTAQCRNCQILEPILKDARVKKRMQRMHVVIINGKSALRWGLGVPVLVLVDGNRKILRHDPCPTDAVGMITLLERYEDALDSARSAASE